MAGKGGYQAPLRPAMVSGPGSLSQRTDGGPGKQPIRPITGLPYGEGQQAIDQQRAAPLPLAASPTTPPPAAGPPAQQQMAPPPAPLSAGSLNPGEPVTNGAAAGAGAGVSALPQIPPAVAQYQSAKQMIDSLASNPNASPALRALQASISRGY